MLRQLYIRDFALIDQLEIAFDGGFSVITGETGAGKSIIIGAVNLLLGARADARQVKTGRDKCIVEATFSLENLPQDEIKALFDEYELDYQPDECILRREVSKAGKSRAFINDTPANLTAMRQLGQRLIDIHSQHQNLLLADDDFQLHVVDIMAADAADVAAYRSSYIKYVEAQKELQRLKDEIAENSRSRDFLEFQRQELQDAHLADGEQEELEQEHDMMAHAEEIQAALHLADDSLNADEHGIVGQLKSAAAALQSVAAAYPSAKELGERLMSSYVELKDVADELTGKTGDVEFDPARMQQVEDRLDVLYTLQQKYHVATTAELIAILQQLTRQLDSIENSDEALQRLQQEVSRLQGECVKLASVLTRKRQQAATVVERELRERLIPLGIPNVRFSVSIEPKDLAADGADAVQLLFSANTSSTMQPVARVASGGEIARVMLSLKAMMSQAVGMPTIIFDEIDTGVSGKVAEQMARIMKEMGTDHCQVICITHLPQIAALGASHFRVSKTETASGTTSCMVQLSKEERIQEIAQMLSGTEITQAAKDNAKALLEKASPLAPPQKGEDR